VRLYVRPQREPVKNAVRVHAVEIVREPVKIDQGRGRLEFFDELGRCRSWKRHLTTMVTGKANADDTETHDDH
jgi:hypothetical protein